MPAKDIYHDTVKTALIKDGWTITHDPLTIRLARKRLYAQGVTVKLEGRLNQVHSPETALKKGSFLGLEFHQLLCPI